VQKPSRASAPVIPVGISAGSTLPVPALSRSRLERPAVSAHFLHALPLTAHMQGAGMPGTGVYRSILLGCHHQAGQMVVTGTC
jgi:hypothetical protein